MLKRRWLQQKVLCTSPSSLRYKSSAQAAWKEEEWAKIFQETTEQCNSEGEYDVMQQQAVPQALQHKNQDR